MNYENYILLTFDVEDWFQVENFKQCIPFSSWPECELRVERNTHRLLDLLDSSSSIQNSKFKIQNSIKATFFILGWIAERLPNLVREIQKRGHEIASHGYRHDLCSDCSPEELKKDLTESKKLLEDITGEEVLGYRAPSFSISDDILKLVQEAGYLYDSSYNSFGMNKRYGKININGSTQKGIAIQVFKNKIAQRFYFYELPISNLPIKNAISYQLSAISPGQAFEKKSFLEKLVLPWSGGGYFRLIPFSFFKSGIRSILKKENAYLFYMHPWEIDPEQPRVNNAALFYKFRHYTNLSKTHSKLSNLVRSFRQHGFITCRQYISELQR